LIWQSKWGWNIPFHSNVNSSNRISELEGVESTEGKRLGYGFLLGNKNLNWIYCTGKLLAELYYDASVYCREEKQANLVSLKYLYIPYEKKLLSIWTFCYFKTKVRDKVGQYVFTTQSLTSV